MDFYRNLRTAEWWQSHLREFLLTSEILRLYHGTLS